MIDKDDLGRLDQLQDLVLFLAKVPLFSSIPLSHIQETAQLFQTAEYKKDDVICRQGEPGDTMYIIRSGVVCVHGQGQAGPVYLSDLRRGDFFGEMALLSDAPRSATVKVALDAVLFYLLKEDFQALLTKNKSMGLFLSRYYARRMAVAPDGTGKPRAPMFYAVSATHSGLGLSHFLYSVSFHVSTESAKRVLVVEPHLELSQAMNRLGLYRCPCPDPGLFGLVSPGIYSEKDFHWFRHKAGFFVLQVNQGFSERLCAALPHLMEGFRERFDLIFFGLSHHLNRLERLLIRLCDKNYVLINNTPEALERVRDRLALVDQIAGPGLDRVRVGVSHLSGTRGVPRKLLKQTLDLSEIPRIWVDRSRAAFGMEIDMEKKMPIQGARAVAREIAGVRVGLALGAGAARGWAHLGVLKVLEEENIPIDMISGTSMGALVGGIYAAGASLDYLKKTTIDRFPSKKIAQRKIFDYTLPFQGLLRGRKAMQLVANAVDHADFMDLLIPAYFVGVDILNGEEVLLEEGDVAGAIRASLSIPAIFVPFFYRGRWMVDGGLLNPVPVDVLQQKGADHLIAVCVESQGQCNGTNCKRPGVFKVISRTISIVHGRAVNSFSKAADVVIYPDVRGFAWDDFHRGQTLMQRGSEACYRAMDEIKRCLNHSGGAHHE